MRHSMDSAKNTCATMGVLNTVARKRLNWLGWSTLLASVPLIHFALSVGVWFMWWGPTQFRFLHEARKQFMFFAPALVLFASSAAAFYLALKRKPAALRLLAITLLAAIAFFWIDVHFHRYQVNVEFATDAYRNNGGRAHYYFTWWWYDDGCDPRL
jgi:hypothetical protein